MFARSTFYALCSIILFLNVNVAEWVDMPQFSNEKIYRIPVQHDKFHKFRRGNTDYNNSPDIQRNDNQTYRRPVKTAHAMDDKETEIKEINTASATPSNLFRDQITDSFPKISKNRTATNADTVTENKLTNRYDTISTIKDRILNTLTTQPSLTTTHKQEMPQNEYYNCTLKQNDGIFPYLPMDILKTVHHTLQSQPVSFEGKLHFLKMFEKTLMSEIESRLVVTMSPSRKIRGADYYGHGYDDHDDHSVGFPSIEGALMAISFLTFAVYLVRLVMLLFRNINNPMMATTTAPTVFLGKRKRSAGLDNDTARILSNMNTFISDF